MTLPAIVDNSTVEILIVEDSLTQSMQLHYILSQHRFKVFSARHGLEALDILAQHKPTLIISDIMMPQMDGYELCRQVRADDRLKEVPVILLTTLSDTEDVVRALESGADNFVTKPYTPEFLLSRIQHILVNKQLRQTAAADKALEIYFANKKYVFGSEPAQIVDLLLSTFENAVQKNLELQQANQKLMLVQRELRQKNEELARLNEQKDYFLGMAAHDLRNPLGRISVVTELLLDDLTGQLAPEHEELLSIARSSSKFMLNLVNNLLDLSQIEAGKLQLMLQSVNLIELVRHNVGLNRILAERKNIKLVFQAHDDPLDVQVDVSKIEQVLNNLIGNAVKFSYPGGVIEIRVSRHGHEALIAVKDQGQGIPANELDRLFKPFEKTSVKSTAGESSTGLGLGIARNIVQGHYGRIWVESQVGRGSTFFVSLPIETASHS